MRQVNSGEWVRDQHVVRQTWRESPWSLEDSSHTRLPVVQSRLARRLQLELAGAVTAHAHQFPCCRSHSRNVRGFRNGAQPLLFPQALLSK